MSVRKLLLPLLFVPSVAWAAAPAVVGTELTATSATTSHVINIPGDACANGSLLVGVAASSDVTNDFTFDTGYNSIAQRVSNSEMGEVFYHECDGSEGTTFTITSSVSDEAATIVWKITGQDNTADPETQVTGGAAATAVDPPAVTPTGGSKDYLWLIVGTHDENAATFVSCPANYTDNCGNGATPAGAGGSDELDIAWSYRANTATSEDPASFTWSGSDTWDAFTIAVHPSAGVPLTFTSGPSRAAAANGHTISGTLTGSGFGNLVAYAVGVSPGDGAPSCAQIKLGHNDGNAAALLAANETWTTAVGDSFALAAANSIARMDVHVCGSDGTNNTSVTSFSDADRSARAGFAIHALTSIAATSIFDMDSYFDPDVVANDVIEYEDDTNESADCNVSFEADGDLVLTPVVAGDCDGRQTFEISYEDVSSATTGLFTAPSTGNFTTDDTIYVNNSTPVCEIQPTNAIRLLIEDEAMTTLDLVVLGDCEDADGDTLTFTEIGAGTIPNGTSLGGTGNKDWSGTPDTEDENGEALTFQACDPAGDCDTFDVDVYVVNTWTVPNCVGNTASECADEIVTAAPWREGNVGLSIGALTCVVGVEGIVLSQDPAASAEAEPFDPISVTLSQTCAAGKRRLGFGLGLGIP